MKNLLSLGVSGAFALGFTATAVSPASADYTYSSSVGSIGTFTNGGTTYSFYNQAFVTEANVGSSNDQAKTRTSFTPFSSQTHYLGSEARLFKDNGQLCKTGGMVYDYEVLDAGQGTAAFSAIVRRGSTCPAGYYYSYGKSAHTSTNGWVYYYTYKSASLYMYN